jgi:hypothetical protein
MAKTVDDFLESVKITVIIPESQALMTSARILAFADEETQNDLVPLIDAINQEYFVTLDQSQTTSDGVSSYNIPTRAIGRKLRDFKLTDGNAIRDVVQVTLDDAHLYNYSGLPCAFHYQGDKIILLPTPNDSSITLMLYYLLRPSKLVLSSAAGLVTGIAGNAVTVSSVPSTFTSGVKVDFIQGTSGCATLAMDQTITNVSGTTVTITTPPTALAIGDYVALKEQTPVIQFPDECYSHLVLRTSKRVLEALGDFEGAEVIDNRLEQSKRNLQQILAPRIEGEGIKIINRNGLLRGYRGLRYYRGVVNN